MGFLLAASIAFLQAFPATEPLLSNAEGYAELREFRSPITGEVFSSPVLRQTPVITSRDADGCPHARLNVLNYSLVIDPATGYVAPPDSFEQPTHLSAAELAAILGEPKFAREGPAGWPWAGAYPWEKFENAARLAEEVDAPAMRIAAYWLSAAWSVRLDITTGGSKLDPAVTRTIGKLPRWQADATDLYSPPELEVARQWVTAYNQGELTELDLADCCLAIAWLFRSRGELAQAQHWLGEAALHNPDLATERQAQQSLLASIELERSYLRAAQEWLRASEDEAELYTGMRAQSALQLGEIARRLGDLARATYWYEEAQRRNLGTLDGGLVEHLLGLVSGGHGY